MLLDLVEDGMSFERDQLVLHPEGVHRFDSLEDEWSRNMYGLDLDLRYL